MTKFKTLFALCIVVAIVSTCILSASAALSSSTSVIWNANETAAKAQTVGSGSVGTAFYVTAKITSNSTGDTSKSSANSNGNSSTLTATTGYVSVTYPSPIPLVTYSGTHGLGNAPSDF